MTPRVLITGSSHVAAVNQGWKLVGEEGHSLIDVDFLAAPVYAFKEFERKPDGRFGLFKSAEALNLTKRQIDVIRKVNGKPFRKLGDFTHSVVIGHRSGVESMIVMAETVGVDGLRRPPPGGTTLSLPAFDAFSRAFAVRRVPLQFKSMLKETQVAIFTMPLRADLTQKEGEGSDKDAKPGGGGLEKLVDRYFKVAAEVYAESGLTLLTQPIETVTSYGTTDIAFNRGGQHLDAAKSNDDPAHMNSIYGKLCIERVSTWAVSGSDVTKAGRV